MISIIIPTYNHCDDLLKPCCESLIKYTHLDDKEIIIVSNGSKDNTKEYVESLGSPFKLLWFDDPLGYSKANNEGLKVSIGDYIVFLNNDVVFLPHTVAKNIWINMLLKSFSNDDVGITGPLKGPHFTTGDDHISFFCAMVKREVIEKVGYLDETFENGCEDVDFCIKAVTLGYKLAQVPQQGEGGVPFMSFGWFPIYHAGSQTLNDNHQKDEITYKNCETIKERCASNWYRNTWHKWKLMNNWERMLFFKNEEITPREKARYEWAAKNIVGSNVLEIGCSNGYGTRLLPNNINYLGIDYDKDIIKEAKVYDDDNHKFECVNINEYNFGYYDTIIAFEIIEHLDNGKEILRKLKNHCKCLLATVPYKEIQNTWHSSPHHKFYNLTEIDFPGFEYKFISEDGRIIDKFEKEDGTNLLLMKWTKKMKNISIIIPCCNFECLKECVASIIRNTDLEKYDIEVVASLNGCDIKAIDFIRGLGDRFRFVWVDQKIGLCASANLAAKICNGIYLIRMDEDSMILDWGKNMWIELLLNSFTEKIGQVGVVKHDWAEYKSIVGFLTMTPKKIWEQIGGWDVKFDKLEHINATGMAEDTDFSIRIQKAGYEVAQAAEHKLSGQQSMPFYGSFPVLHSSNGSWRYDSQ